MQCKQPVRTKIFTRAGTFGEVVRARVKMEGCWKNLHLSDRPSTVNTLNLSLNSYRLAVFLRVFQDGYSFSTKLTQTFLESKRRKRIMYNYEKKRSNAPIDSRKKHQRFPCFLSFFYARRFFFGVLSWALNFVKRIF